MPVLEDGDVPFKRGTVNNGKKRYDNGLYIIILVSYEVDIAMCVS